MSNIRNADILAYLQKALELKAEIECAPLVPLFYSYESLLRKYPLALKQMQAFLVPKARQNYNTLIPKVEVALSDLHKFDLELEKLRYESEYLDTISKWNMIRDKLELLNLPYEELTALKKQNKQEIRKRKAEEEQERKRKAEEEQERKRKAEEEQERKRKAEEEQEQERKRKAEEIKLGYVVIISLILLFGMSTCVFKGNTEHESTDLNPIVETPTAEPVVKAKQKKPEKIDNRASLESYLKGIRNGCDFNPNVAILTPVLEYVRVSTGPDENDYDYILPPDDKMVEKYPDLYKAIPVVIVKPGYFEVSADINGKFYGLTASKLIRGYGNENGIRFFTLVFDSPNAESILKKKINFKTQWSEIGHRELGVDFYVEDGKTHMTCDWSD